MFLKEGKTPQNIYDMMWWYTYRILVYKMHYYIRAWVYVYMTLTRWRNEANRGMPKKKTKNKTYLLTSTKQQDEA